MTQKQRCNYLHKQHLCSDLRIPKSKVEGSSPLGRSAVSRLLFERYDRDLLSGVLIFGPFWPEWVSFGSVGTRVGSFSVFRVAKYTYYPSFGRTRISTQLANATVRQCLLATTPLPVNFGSPGSLLLVQILNKHQGNGSIPALDVLYLPNHYMACKRSWVRIPLAPLHGVVRRFLWERELGMRLSSRHRTTTEPDVSH